MKDLYIIGAGGFGRDALEIALDMQEQVPDIPWRVKGFLTDIPGDFYEKDTLGYDIEGDITHHKVYTDAVYAFAIADIAFKIKTTRDYLDKGAQFVNLIHPTARISRTAKIGMGNIISPGVNVNANAVIGNFVRIGTGTNVGHDAEIGNYSTISGLCGINGYVKIDKGVFAGSHAVFCPHAKVGEFATVGASSVVLKKVQANSKVFGNPAKKFGTNEVMED